VSPLHDGHRSRRGEGDDGRLGGSTGGRSGAPVPRERAFLDHHPTANEPKVPPMKSNEGVNRVVTREEWLKARAALLAKEKEFSKQRDALARERRALPWVRVDKEYVFDGPRGSETLSELFAGRSQLLVYHFMLGPGWAEGCKSCSYIADNFQGAIVHLEQRDVTFVAISRAPLAEIEAFKKRMGWTHKWVSASGTDFNFDYGVSFREGESKTYNYAPSDFPVLEGPGASAFAKDAQGHVHHTYSTYARGLDILIGTYNLLDLTPAGRNEEGLPHGMAWVRHHDRY
jgi:predicted dithiol-disulfide oxidoreductase (DUF899 family)